MKLINQSFEFIQQGDYSIVGIKKFIERCARVSYKSEDRITDTSYEKFVDNLIYRKHDRPLEFGTVHLVCPSIEFDSFVFDLISHDLWNPMWIKTNIMHSEGEDLIYITTNYRLYLNMLKVLPRFENYFTDSTSSFFPNRLTAHMVISRGVMDEFRTHVGLSHLAESTRYVNYSKDKFGNEITFIEPDWVKDTNRKKLVLKSSLKVIESTYLLLLQEGCKPQEARATLPLCVKSELISCGFEDAWRNFFWRRCAKDAHPMAKEIADKMHKKFINITEVNSF